MTSLNVASIQFFKRKITQPPVHSHRSTGSPVHQSNCKPVDQLTVTSLPVLDSRLTTHDSQLISALGLVEFSIQWFWSIATNPSLELTGTIY